VVTFIKITRDGFADTFASEGKREVNSTVLHSLVPVCLLSLAHNKHGAVQPWSLQVELAGQTMTSATDTNQYAKLSASDRQISAAKRLAYANLPCPGPQSPASAQSADQQSF
jgi:hypothetical protein